MNKVKFIIHPSFILLLLIGLYGGFLKEVVLFSIIVILHELGHLIAAKICKVRYYAIHLTIIGCLIDLDAYQDISFIKKIFINSSGIIVNVFLMIIFAITNYELLYEYNKLMIFINLLPIMPLDGYKLLYAIFTLIFDDEYTKDCLFYLSMIILVVLTIIILILGLYGYLLIIGFLYYKTFRNKKYDRLSNLLIIKKMQFS